MPRWRISPLLLTGMLSLILGIAACSDDDDNGGQPPGDTVAPVVSVIEPNNQTGVSLNEPVVVEFSEAMDQDTADGNITLSQGTITGFTWLNDYTVSVAHSNWPEATQVTVTVGAGMTDLAGNHLPHAWTASFWTESSNVVFLTSEPANGATDVNRSVQPRLLFSQRMNLPSLIASTTITDNGKSGVVVPEWTISDAGSNWYRIVFASDLDATTSYTIQVSTAAQAEGGQNLSAAVSITFTTGSVADTDPPIIVSASPAGGNVNPDQTTITITFSEPLDTQADVKPDRINGQLMTTMAGEPTWNGDNTILTVYLQPPLPAGVRFFAVFGPGSFQDMSGNPNAETDSVSFTVAGAPDHFPINRDWEYYYFRAGFHETIQKDYFEDEIKEQFENISGQTFDWVRYRWDEFGVGGWVVDDRQYIRKNSSGIYFRGFNDEGQADVMFTPEVLYQDLPMANTTWDGSATTPYGVTTLRVDYEGATTGPEVLVYDSESPDEPNLVFENSYRSTLYHALTVVELSELQEVGTDTLWYAPGIGVLQTFSGSTEYADGVPAEIHWERQYMQEIRIR